MSHRALPRWRSLAATMVLAATLSFVLRAHADDDMPVPIDLQAELLSKVTAYDRGAAGRAGQVVHVLLVAKHGDPSSMPAVLQMRQALTRVGLFGSLSHVEQVIEYTNAAALADMCRSQNAAIVYFGPGFRDDVASIRVALESVTTLTVAAQPADVPRGIVLGFDLVSGRPKLLYQLTQARKQHVDLKADVLKLMRIYE